MINFKNTILEYFKTLDSSLEKFSIKSEGNITRLPLWTLTHREICLGLNESKSFLIIKVIPNDKLQKDRIVEKKMTSQEDVAGILSPLEADFSINKLPKNNFVMFEGITVTEANNPLAKPVMEFPGVIGWGNLESALNSFSVIEAKKGAINLWNNALHNRPRTESFIHETRLVFTKFSLLMKRKAFLERKIHRFINAHRDILLPNFKNCFFEIKLKLGKEFRKADFIIEREEGIPALLIELENPSYRMFRKDGELTAEANHARSQIAEWVRFIEQNPQINASGPLYFLNGRKDRLVIMGRGLNNRKKMIDSKYTDTTMWTYNLFLEQAKSKWNDIINNQCQTIGIERITPF